MFYSVANRGALPTLWKLEIFYSMANHGGMPTVWKLEGKLAAASAVWPT